VAAIKSSSTQIDARALARHKKRFLRFFPRAFKDQRYIDWERTYKWDAHQLWLELLGKDEFARLLHEREFEQVAARAMQVESKCNFLFSFEKMALRDGVRSREGARTFSEGLFQLLHGKGGSKERFVSWIVAVSELPRKKSRVLSWPVLTFFPFIAQPDKHIIMKPMGMRAAARELGYQLDYSSTPNYRGYESLLNFAELIRDAISDLKPRDYHDLQSFLWTVGSEEYRQLEQEL